MSALFLCKQYSVKSFCKQVRHTFVAEVKCAAGVQAERVHRILLLYNMTQEHRVSRSLAATSLWAASKCLGSNKAPGDKCLGSNTFLGCDKSLGSNKYLGNRSVGSSKCLLFACCRT